MSSLGASRSGRPALSRSMRRSRSPARDRQAAGRTYRSCALGPSGGSGGGARRWARPDAGACRQRRTVRQRHRAPAMRRARRAEAAVSRRRDQPESVIRRGPPLPLYQLPLLGCMLDVARSCAGAQRTASDLVCVCARTLCAASQGEMFATPLRRAHATALRFDRTPSRRGRRSRAPAVRWLRPC